MDVEFVDGPSSGADVPEELAEHRSGPPRWTFALVAAAIVAATVIVVTQRNSDTVPHAAASTSATSPYEPPFPAPPSPTLGRGIDPVLFSVYARARDSVPATDVVRSGSSTGACRSVTIGTHPQQLITRTFVRGLRSFRVIDSAVILDQDAGLCSVQVRAADGKGVVALLVVTAPDRAAAPTSRGSVTHNVAQIGGDYVEYAAFRSRDGWEVTVGASGTRSRLPGAATLRSLATSPVLRW